MKLATTRYANDGWEVKNVSRRNGETEGTPYDLRCTQHGEVRHVEVEEMIEPVPSLDRRQVDEVPRLRTPEDREHLVDCELLAAERRCEPPRLCRKEPGIRSKIELRALAATLAISRAKPEFSWT